MLYLTPSFIDVAAQAVPANSLCCEFTVVDRSAVWRLLCLLDLSVPFVMCAVSLSNIATSLTLAVYGKICILYSVRITRTCETSVVLHIHYQCIKMRDGPGGKLCPSGHSQIRMLSRQMKAEHKYTCCMPSRQCWWLELARAASLHLFCLTHTSFTSFACLPSICWVRVVKAHTGDRKA